MRAAGRTEPPSCTARVACLREMAANLRCTSHPFCLRRGPGGKGTGGSVIARSSGRSRVPLRERFGLRVSRPSYRPMTSSLSATSNVRATSPSSVSCTSLATTLDIFAFVHRGVGYRLDDAAVNGALSPRALPKSLCETRGNKRFIWHHEVRSRYIFAETCDCSHCRKIRGLLPPPQSEFSTHFSTRAPMADFLVFSALPSRRLDRGTPHNSTRGIPSTKGRTARRNRPDRLDSFATGRPSFLPRRTATRVSRTTRRSSRGPPKALDTSFFASPKTSSRATR